MTSAPPGRKRAVLLDGALAVVLAVTSLLLGADVFVETPAHEKVTRMFGPAQVWQQHVTVWWVAAAVMLAAIPARRIWPLAAVIAAAAGSAVHLLDPDIPVLAADLAVPVTVYSYASVTASRTRSLTLLAVLQACLYIVCVVVTDTGGMGLSAPGKNMSMFGATWQDSALLAAAAAAAEPALLLGFAWAVGDATRARRAHLAALEARAQDAEREAAQRAALAVITERGRITRELHDVIAHGLSVIVVQAQAADAALDRHPDRSRQALTHVIATGRASLTDMRRLLGLVRTSSPDVREPQPTLADLPALVDQIRAAGVPVELTVGGDPYPLPGTVELAAYRIVQEALTNTLKHAGLAATSHVAVEFGREGLRLTIRDTGQRQTPAPAAGNGLRGITERVAALGGTLHAGPGPDCGFHVAATIPVPDVP